ncbi:GNAT family N-acetyltransferase [Nocardiopsis ansamitocini]|uniref:N-acetyltransferase domain-containing protein n=1 Tax=Nocardiopsis ansamitocini TaxID=1670832 RepID=A0A9W6UKN1_9ACTN|nr:GNAT family N-acetyltransferase [Nocardiopsis ansamitocini]GLU49907.1 hypothetical protein Nans01_42580 [Nocardiopsis ansamitocini]
MNDFAVRRRVRTTPRLRLEPVGPEHIEDLLELHREEAVPSPGEAWDREAATRSAQRCAAGWALHGAQQWMAYDAASGAVVGRGGVSLQQVEDIDRWEAGWEVRPGLRGRGYATEIGRAGLDFAFGELGADEVVAFAEHDNAPSLAVMRRLGMTYRHDIRHCGTPCALYSLKRPPDAGRARSHG